MVLQSILVYSITMTLMILLGVSTSSKIYSSNTNEGLVKDQRFWQFDTIAILLIFAIIFGMRYDVGADHINYIKGYLLQDYVGKSEPLFFFFSDIGWFLNLHYTVYFAVLAFFQLFFLLYAFKNEKWIYPLLIFFLFTNGEFFFWMNGIRQALAMCIWINSLRYVVERKMKLYFIMGFISILFHKSAIFLFVFYPILRNGKDYFKNIPLQLVLLALAFIIKNLFFQVIMQFESVINFYISLLGADTYKGYGLESLMESFSEDSGTGMAYMFKIVINVVIILYSNRLKNFYNSKWFIIVYFFFFVGLFSLYIFPEGAISFTRPFQYFYVFQSIMIAYFAFYLFKKRKDGRKLVLLSFLILSFIAIFFLSQYTASEKSSTLYQFYFQHNIMGYPNFPSI